MVHKVIDATALHVGGYCIIDNEACVVKSMDISKTGKHGHAKVRLEAVGILSEKKKVLVVPGHERFEVPMIEKKKAQVLSISGDNANLMDSESFENFDLNIPEELSDKIKDGVIVEYWDVEGQKIIKRAL